MKIIQKERRRPTCLWYLDKTKEWEFQSFLPHAVVMGFCLKNSPLSGYGQQRDACGFPVKRGCWIFDLCGAFYKLKTQSRVCTTVTSSSKIPQPIIAKKRVYIRSSKHTYQPIRARVRFGLSIFLRIFHSSRESELSLRFSKVWKRLQRIKYSTNILLKRAK